jgi:MoxR-like ATPase
MTLDTSEQNYNSDSITSPSINENEVDQIQSLQNIFSDIKKELSKTIVGQEDAIEKLFLCLLSRGHGLLMGVPGLAKTLLVNSLAQTTSLSFGRIQFTPDLMPSDVTGTEILQQRDTGGGRDFTFIKGPIFANVILADEINRTPPKTQSALLEAMQEQHVTVAGKNHELAKPFFVLATQNPIEQEGTYPLPEAQLDRFMFIIKMDYPEREQELSIAKQTTVGGTPKLQEVITGEKLIEYQDLTEKIPVPDHVYELAVDLVRKTRPKSKDAPDWVKEVVEWGAGPRAIQFLIKSAKAQAIINGNYIVSEQDLESVAEPVLNHRIITNFHARSEGITSSQVVQRLIKEVSKAND